MILAPTLSDRLGATLRSLWLDALVALRMMRRTPAMSGAALLTLALGIGVNAAMFTVVYDVLLRPLPFDEPSRLVRIGEDPATLAQTEAIRESGGLQATTALGRESMILEHQGQAFELSGLLVDGHHYDVFGKPPELGRGLLPTDSLPGAEPVVVLSHSTWQRYFGADSEVLGKVVAFSRPGAERHTVVGVHTTEYQPTASSVDFLVPALIEPGSHDWQDMARYWVLARLASEETTLGVQARIRQHASRLAERGEVFDRRSAAELTVRSLLDARVGSVERQLWSLLAVVLVVLLIACANVANLVLVRQLARGQEFSVRRALGGSRSQIARQMLVEGMTLAGLGGLAGLLLATASVPLLVGLVPTSLPRADQIAVSTPTLVFSGVLSLVVGAAFALAPLARASRGDASLRQRRGTGSSRRANEMLVAGQIALCVVLLTACGVLVRSLGELHRVDPGFDFHGLETFSLSPPANRYAEEASRMALVQEIEEAMAAVAGVASVGGITTMPLTSSLMGVGISPDGRAVPDGEPGLMVNYRAITPGYVPTVRVPLLRGRNVSASDTAEAEKVGLVNQKLAVRLFGDRDPIDQMVTWGTGEPWFRVVGVLGDVHQVDLATAVRDEVYVPYAQEAWLRGINMIARTDTAAGSTIDLGQPLLAAIRSVDPLVPVVAQRSMPELLDASMARETFNAYFFGCFAALGVLLSAIGLYGTTLFLVAQRQHEIGVRTALGAKPRALIALVVRSNVPAMSIGLVLGLAMAFGTARFLDSMLFGVRATDPLTVTTVVVLLAGSAIAVSGLAARNAARLDPASVLDRD